MCVWFGKCFWAIIIFFTLTIKLLWEEKKGDKIAAEEKKVEEKKDDKIAVEEKKVEEKKDDKIAVVNGIDISRKDFDQEMDAVRRH